MKKRLLQTLIRVLVSASLITFLLITTDLPELWTALKLAAIWLLAISISLFFCGVLVSAIRWHVMLRAKGVSVSLGSLIYFYMVGIFFNLFLPTVLGGDIMRGYELARATGRTLDSVTTVLMERIVGFIALFVICWIALPFGYKQLEGTNTLPIVAAMSIAFLLLCLVIFNRRIMGALISLTSPVKHWNLHDRLQAGVASLHSLAESKSLLFKTLVYSLAYQFIGIVSAYCISEALALNVGFTYFLIIMPVIWVIMMIPISISGLGVREGAFVLFLGQQGVPEGKALLLSLLVFAMTLIGGLVGGVIYAWGGYRHRDRTGKGESSQ